jgi:hypothetical protein
MVDDANFWLASSYSANVEAFNRRCLSKEEDEEAKTLAAVEFMDEKDSKSRDKV